MGLAKDWSMHDGDLKDGCATCYQGFPICCPACDGVVHGKLLPEQLWACCEECGAEVDITDFAEFLDGELTPATIEKIGERFAADHSELDGDS